MPIATSKNIPSGVTTANYSRLINNLVLASEPLAKIFPTMLGLMPHLFLRDVLTEWTGIEEGDAVVQKSIPRDAASIIEAALTLRKFDSVQWIHNADYTINFAVGLKSGYNAWDKYEHIMYVICQWGETLPTIASLIGPPRRAYYIHRLKHPSSSLIFSAILITVLILAQAFLWFGELTGMYIGVGLIMSANWIRHTRRVSAGLMLLTAAALLGIYLWPILA